MTKDEALKLALEALRQIDEAMPFPVAKLAQAALRKALAEQPEQEPVKYRLAETDIYDFAGWLTTRKGVMQIGSSSEAGPMAEAVGEYLKTFPERFAPQRTWAGLTDEDTKLLWAEHGYKSAMCKPFARAIEAKLKEKNT